MATKEQFREIVVKESSGVAGRDGIVVFFRGSVKGLPLSTRLPAQILRPDGSRFDTPANILPGPGKTILLAKVPEGQLPDGSRIRLWPSDKARGLPSQYRERRRAEARSRRGLIDIVQRDPNFDSEHLVARVAGAFETVQRARVTHDVAALSPIVSDGILERFMLQIDEERHRQERYELRGIQLNGVTLNEAVADAHFDVLMARIRGSWVRTLVSMQDGRRLEGPALAPERLDICWSFIRRLGTQTRGQKGLLEGDCPNCGAPLPRDGMSARCSSCHSWIRSPEYDWVLSEITDYGDWRPSRGSDTPGMSEILEHDPAFNLQHLEDRVSVIFWRWLKAQRQGDVAPLRASASRHFCEQQTGRFATDAKDDREHWSRAHVGGVYTHGFLRDPDGERALVEVRWSALRRVIDGDEKSEEPEVAHSALRHLLVLRRPTGAKTQLAHTLNSAHCPGCGAAEDINQDDACAYCGHGLGELSEDWILEELQPLLSNRAQLLLRRVARGALVKEGDALAGTLSGAALFGWVVREALADGELDAAEQRILAGLGRRCGVSSARVEATVEAARRGQLDVAKPADLNEAKTWLERLVDLLLEDGELDDEEIRLLEGFGRRRADVPDVFFVRQLIKRLRHAKLELAQGH